MDRVAQQISRACPDQDVQDKVLCCFQHLSLPWAFLPCVFCHCFLLPALFSLLPLYGFAWDINK